MHCCYIYVLTYQQKWKKYSSKALPFLHTSCYHSFSLHPYWEYIQWSFYCTHFFFFSCIILHNLNCWSTIIKYILNYVISYMVHIEIRILLYKNLLEVGAFIHIFILSRKSDFMPSIHSMTNVSFSQILHE